MVSSSSSERYESASSITTSQKNEKSRRRDRRSSPPTDTEDEDPFHFDSVLSPPSPTRNKAADGTRSTLSSSFLRRASIVPVDPTAEPAPHRFSLLRERASEETIFVQEICDAEGRRWSLRVPASGLPEDMVHMLEELEKLAVELGQALPRIVVTCSAESLSLKRMERNAIVDSSELLRPPPAVDDENLGGGDAGGGRSLAKEKRRLVEKGSVSEGPEKPSEPSSIALSSVSEQSLTCIYLPEVSCHPRLGPSLVFTSNLRRTHQMAPEFLSGSSTSPVLQPANGFHSKPGQTQCPRQHAFFSALKEPQPTSGIAKRLVPRLAKTETESGTAIAAAAAASGKAAPFSSSVSPPAKPKPRMQAAKPKSALPVLKANSKSSTTVAVAAAATATAVNERHRACLAPLSESPTRQEDPRASGATQRAFDHVPHTRAAGVAMTTTSSTGAGGSAAGGGTHQDAAPATSLPSLPSTQPPDRSSPAGPDAPPAVSAPPPPTGRKLRHLFRRPPVRSASDPPLYSYPATQPVTNEGVKRPASDVLPAPREAVERKMPRLPSARDLLRKLT